MQSIQKIVKSDTYSWTRWNWNGYKIKTIGDKTRQNAKKQDVSQKVVRDAQENNFLIRQAANGQNENYFL